MTEDEQNVVQNESNVIQFPNKQQFISSNRQINTFEDYEKRSVELTRLFAEEVVLSVFEDVMFKLGQANAFDHEEFPQDIGMLFEAIKSMQYRILDLEHPLHEIADEMYPDYRYAYDEIDEEDFD